MSTAKTIKGAYLKIDSTAYHNLTNVTGPNYAPTTLDATTLATTGSAFEKIAPDFSDFGNISVTMHFDGTAMPRSGTTAAIYWGSSVGKSWSFTPAGIGDSIDSVGVNGIATRTVSIELGSDVTVTTGTPA